MEQRTSLEPILEESFEGWYLRHSIRTLHEIGKVRTIQIDGKAVGLSMLKTVEDGIGYIYYLAVTKENRRMGFGTRLVDDALAYFATIECSVVFASVENDDAQELFASRGFRKTDFASVSKKYGFLKAISMYRSMLSVPGEILLEAAIPLPSPASGI